MHTANNFQSNSGSGTFADRQKKLFDHLSIAERECNRGKTNDTKIVPMVIESLNSGDGRCLSRSNKRRKSETRQFCGKESIFKRPEGPAPRSNSYSIPDHHRNPHKWMKYSLDDVSTNDMTDRSNASAAFAFLEELKVRRAREDLESKEDPKFLMDTNEDNSFVVARSPMGSKQSAGIQFKKPQTARISNCQNPIIINREERSVFLSTKVLMPEYVVGQKQKQKQRRKEDKEKKVTLAAKVDRTKELKLNHLEEFEDEDEII